jgi:anti-repressor protein
MDSNLFSLYQKRRHSGACKPFQVRLTASIVVGHATGRQHVQVMLQQSKGRSESTDGIGSTPVPATQPHPLVRVRHTTSTSKGKSMSNEIQQFYFNNAALRTLTDEAGEPWFVAKDVCDILEISNPSDALKRLDDDERSRFNLGRQGETNIVNEAGLYALVLGSRKPEAHEFKRWVTHEVLPQIRRTGGYIPARETDDDITILAKAVMIGQRTMEEQKRRIAAQQSRIVELEPKALFADAVAASDGTCLVGELAKMLRQNGLNIGQNRLFQLLRDDGFFGKSGSNRNVPTQKAMDLGLFRIKETAVTHSDGHVTISRTPKVTGKGQRYFIARYCPKKPND